MIMDLEYFIPVIQLCEQYEVEASFFNQLHQVGLIEIRSVKKNQFIHEDSLIEIEKIIRIHRDLNVNLEGIDVVLNLLKKVDHLQSELLKVQNRLQRYEGEL
jgi:hypothetical protein